MRRRRTFGQSLVEFALVLPLLTMLLLGLADFGFLFYGHVQVANAAREGARAGSLWLSSRFYYGNTDPDCWTLQRWVENALTEHELTNAGCPKPDYKVAPHAFGLLNGRPCTVAVVSDCWTLQALPSTVDAGDELEVHVTYRFNVLFVGDLVGIVNNPVSIDKRVFMKVQNN